MIAKRRNALLPLYMLFALIATGCRGGSTVDGKASKSRIATVRHNGDVAVAAFKEIWPAFTAGKTDGVSAFRRYDSCDDFSRTYAYNVHGIALANDVATPAARIAAMRSALAAHGWVEEASSDDIVLVRARKGPLTLVMTSFKDRYLLKVESACSPVTDADTTVLSDDNAHNPASQDVPGLPNVGLPDPSGSATSPSSSGTAKR